MIEEAIRGRVDLLIPDLVLAELERVLTSKLGFSTTEREEAQATLKAIATAVPSVPSNAEPITGDPHDDPILAYAVEQGADVLVTGDRRHLLPITEHCGVPAVTPQALLAELARERGRLR